MPCPRLRSQPRVAAVDEMSVLCDCECAVRWLGSGGVLASRPLLPAPRHRGSRGSRHDVLCHSGRTATTAMHAVCSPSPALLDSQARPGGEVREQGEEPAAWWSGRSVQTFHPHPPPAHPLTVTSTQLIQHSLLLRPLALPLSPPCSPPRPPCRSASPPSSCSFACSSPPSSPATPKTAPSASGAARCRWARVGILRLPLLLPLTTAPRLPLLLPPTSSSS